MQYLLEEYFLFYHNRKPSCSEGLLVVLVFSWKHFSELDCQTIPNLCPLSDGIYRIAGFVEAYGITFNQFLIDDEHPSLMHTWPVGIYAKIEQNIKKVIPIERLAYITFLHFESDEWGGMEFLKYSNAKSVCSDLSSKLHLTGWYNMPVDHISFWDNDTLKTGKRTPRFIMTPHVHHWDSMMGFEDTTKSLFPSDLFIQQGVNKPVITDDLSEQMIAL
jgi:flavorubredoxin